MAVRVTTAPLAVAFTGDRVRVTAAPLAVAFQGNRVWITSVVLAVAFIPTPVTYVPVQIFLLN